MGLEVNPRLGTWLAEQGVVPKKSLVPAKQNGNKKMAVDGKNSALFENGVKIFQLLEVIAQSQHTPLDANAASLQNQQSPAAKLYNWNFLSPLLASFNISLDVDMKALIVAGDTEVIAELLEQMMNVDKGSKGSRNGGDGGEGYTGINTRKHNQLASGHGPRIKTEVAGITPEKSRGEGRNSEGINAARNWVELLAAVFAYRLQIGEKQAASLVQGSPEYFQRLCRHGMHGNINAVSRAYQDIFNNGKRLAGLMAKDSNTLTAALSMLKFGLMSSSAEVAVWAARVLAKIGLEFRQSKSYPVLWDWFVMEQEGLDACVQSHRVHGNLKGSLFQVIDAFSYGHLHDLLVEDMRRIVSNPLDYMVFLPSLFPHLASNRACKDAIVSMGTIDNVVDYALKFSDSNAPNSTRLAAVELLADSWLHFPDLVELRTDATRQILGLMKKNCRDSNIQLQIASITCLYSLLDFFTEQRNAFAPVVYKTLIFSLIENHGDEFMRNYIMTNMIVTLEKTPNIPVGVMLDPLIKQVTMHGYHNLDFDFFLTLSKHPKLDLRYALQFIELLGRIVLTDTLNSRLATIPFLIILNRFGQAQEMIDWLDLWVVKALEHFMENAPAAIGVAPSTRTSNDLDTESALVATILEAIAKIGHLGIVTINNRVHAQLLEAIRSFVEQHQREHEGLTSIVRYFGDDSAINNELSMFTKRPPSQRGFAMDVNNNNAKRPVEPTSSRSSLATEHIEEPTSDKGGTIRATSPERARARIFAVKRQRDIEKVKQRRAARLEKERLEEERKRLKSARVKRKLKEYREQQVKAWQAMHADDDDEDIQEDPSVIERLNAELLKTPEMDMPKGYIKVRVGGESPRRKSVVPPSGEMSPDDIALDILDSILFDSLALHIIDQNDDPAPAADGPGDEGRQYVAKFDHAAADARRARREQHRVNRSGITSENDSPEPGRKSRGPPRDPDEFNPKNSFAANHDDLSLKFPDALQRANAVFMLQLLDHVFDEAMGFLDPTRKARKPESKPGRGVERLNERERQKEMEFQKKEMEREKRRKKRMEEAKKQMEEYMKKKTEIDEQKKEEEAKLKFASEAAKEKERQAKEKRKAEQASRLEEWTKKKKEEEEEKAKKEKEQQKKLAEDKKKFAEDYEKRSKEREERDRKRADEKQKQKEKEEAEALKAKKARKTSVASTARTPTDKPAKGAAKKPGVATVNETPRKQAPPVKETREEKFIAPDGAEETMDIED